jgi:VanZ family protein
VKRIFFSIMTLGLVALIAWGALRYAPPIPKLFDQQDKLEHFIAFAALTLWLTVTLGVRNVFKAIALAIIAAIALEIAQGALSETRSGSVLDAIFSLMGVASASVFMLVIREKLRLRRPYGMAA